MTGVELVTALGFHSSVLVQTRIPKKLLIDRCAKSDRQLIKDEVSSIEWTAALKPDELGVAEYKDDARDYAEIALLHLSLKTSGHAQRLESLVHRAVPHPVLLVTESPAGSSMSLAHIRKSLNVLGGTIVDGEIASQALDQSPELTDAFTRAMSSVWRVAANLHALVAIWLECFEAYAASRITSAFSLTVGAEAATRRRQALVEHVRLLRDQKSVSARAVKETQMRHRVELNLKLKQIAAALEALAPDLVGPMASASSFPPPSKLPRSLH